MSDNSPRSPDRKLGLIAPLTIAAVVGAILIAAFIMRNAPEPAPAAPAAPTPAPPPPVAPLEPQTPPPLSRAELVQAASAFAGEFASGEAAAEAGKDPLVGRAFKVRIAFGCDGPGARPIGAQAFTEYDAGKQTLRLTAAPADWTTLPLIRELNAEDLEAAEGFWLPHPWTHFEGCLPKADRPPPATPTPPSAQTLGLVQLFDESGSRVLRRGQRPYEFVRKLPAEDPSTLTHAYWLVIEGRLTGFASGRALRCWSESPQHRPVCLYAVAFERVAFEDAETGQTLAEWRG